VSLKTLLLFDIDGTLLRAVGTGRKTFIRVFNELYGSSAGFQDVSFIGQTDPEVFQEAARQLMGRGLDRDEYAAVTGRFAAVYGEELAKCERFYLMPGVAALVGALAAREDVVLGLATGNLEATARAKLRRGGIDHHFPFGGFGSDAPDRPGLVRAALAKARRLTGLTPERAFIIDDSPHGIDAARQAGVATIAVGTGLSDHGDVLAASPTHFLPDLTDAAAFLRCAGLT
jgi:phosphoglycolate phosphatase